MWYDAKYSNTGIEQIGSFFQKNVKFNVVGASRPSKMNEERYTNIAKPLDDICESEIKYCNIIIETATIRKTALLAWAQENENFDLGEVIFLGIVCCIKIDLITRQRF